jgi:hypothetical protein
MTKYRPNEELYISVMQPAKRANLIIDGAYFPEDESRDEILVLEYNSGGVE